LVLHGGDVFDEGTVLAGLVLPGLLGQFKDSTAGVPIEQIERQEARGCLGDLLELEHEVVQHISLLPIPVLHLV
jgi:hypothetical protein